MEPPLQQQQPQAPPLSTTPHLSYQDSIDSSPRSRTTETWDDPLPQMPGGSKLRLMCSYGGHIVPRPHDKSLCYVGGDTRMVVVDRHTSLSDLCSRLAKTLLHSRGFTLKYQLPNEDLDSLISVTTDEDLDNMIDEYDRICSNNSSVKFSRIRLFLFPTKPESTSSTIEIGSIFDSATKSDDWFLSALNGATGALDRGFSDTQSVNCLLGLDSDVVTAAAGGVNGGNDGSLGSRELDGSHTEFGGGGGGGGGVCKNLKHGGQDVHSVPDSPMLDTTSSFGSTSSSPSLANLPPIRVHVEDGGGGGGGGLRVMDQKLGIEEQFAHITVAASAQKQDEGFAGLSSPPPPMLTSIISSAATSSAIPMSSAAAGGEYQNRVYSDDERSEQGMHVGYRRLPQPQPQTLLQNLSLPQQSQPKPSGGVELPSPDSVSSDGSLTNAMYRPKPMIYQDQKPMNITDPNTRVQIQQQVQESGYIMQPQMEQQQQQQQQQQQFIHAGTHYIQQPSGQVPMSSYYSVYPPQQQHHHQQLDQQYPVYYMPARQTQQAYNMSMQQSNFSEALPANPVSRPQTPPNPGMLNTPATYSQARNAPPPKTEMAAGVYRTAAAPPLVQVAPNQHQQQYVGYSQIHHPSQSMAPASAATANYAYEFADPSHAQIYYTQPYGQPLPAQYQTMTSASAAGLPDTSSQPLSDQMKQQIRTTQAL